MFWLQWLYIEVDLQPCPHKRKGVMICSCFTPPWSSVTHPFLTLNSRGRSDICSFYVQKQGICTCSMYASSYELPCWYVSLLGHVLYIGTLVSFYAILPVFFSVIVLTIMKLFGTLSLLVLRMTSLVIGSQHFLVKKDSDGLQDIVSADSPWHSDCRLMIADNLRWTLSLDIWTKNIYF